MKKKKTSKINIGSVHFVDWFVTGWSEKTPLHEYMYMEVARSCVHLHD